MYTTEILPINIVHICATIVFFSFLQVATQKASVPENPKYTIAAASIQFCIDLLGIVTL